MADILGPARRSALNTLVSAAKAKQSGLMEVKAELILGLALAIDTAQERVDKIDAAAEAPETPPVDPAKTGPEGTSQTDVAKEPGA